MNTVAILCTSEGTSSSDDSHMEPVPVVIDDIAVANEESESSDVELTFLGHARHGVKLRRVDISRSQKAAKIAIKFALNIIEFLLIEEQITTTSVYGNKQHKLFPMDVQKLEGLHSHIDNVYTKGMEAKEREAAWEAVTDALNNKLRKLPSQLLNYSDIFYSESWHYIHFRVVSLVVLWCGPQCATVVLVMRP